MLVLVTGDASSGKSEYAENLAMKLSEKRIYAATMKNDGKENRERTERHRRMRAGKGFVTMECPERLKEKAAVILETEPDYFEGASILLEDVPNLLANEMFGNKPCGDPLQDILSLSQRSAHLVIVTGNLFTGGYGYDSMTMDYLKKLAGLNRSIAARADEVWEVVCGIPEKWKGKGI